MQNISIEEWVNSLRKIDSPFLTMGDVSYKYSELCLEIDRSLKILKLKNVNKKSRLLLIGDYNILSIASCLAAWICNSSIILQTIESSEINRSYIEEIGYSHIITFDENKIKCVNINIPKIDIGDSRKLIFFTSGTSGKPKAIVHKLDNLMKKFQGKKRQNFSLIPFLLFDHMGGLNTLISALYNHGHLVIPTDRKVETIVNLIHKHKINLLPTTPTFIASLIMHSNVLSKKLKSLELVTYGAEVMSQNILNRAQTILPNTNFKQTYGLTETGVLKTISKDKSTFFKIVDEKVETKIQDGILWIKCYSNYDFIVVFKDNTLPQIQLSENSWICTDDLTEVDGNYIRILGRKSDLINVAGQKFYPQELENTILELPIVTDVSIHAKKNALTGSTVEATCVLNDPNVNLNDFKVILKNHLRSRVSKFMIPSRIKISNKTNLSTRLKKKR